MTAGLAETIAPRMILARERNRKLLEATRNQTRKNLDKLKREVCKFEQKSPASVCYPEVVTGSRRPSGRPGSIN